MLENITINEHSSIRITDEDTGVVIYCDPFHIPAETKDADIILITHPHYDHFSPEDCRKVMKPGSVLIIPETIEAEVLEAGFEDFRLIKMRPHSLITVSGVNIAAIPSYNVNKPNHLKGKGWLGYILSMSCERIYIAGDTDLIPEGIASRCDIALVPIGGTYTMNAEEAAEFVNRMQPEVAIPTHYGSIVGTPEDAETFKSLVKEPIEVCIKICEAPAAPENTETAAEAAPQEPEETEESDA